MAEPIRINKWLSQLGVASRRGAEKLISEKRIKVNGEVIEDLGRKVDPEVDRIEVDDKLVQTERPPLVYWLFHKPDFSLCSAVDEGDKPSIFSLPKLAKVSFKLSSVGRLDFRTEGLLLLSNDGEVVNRLMHPKYKVPRHYIALVNGKLEKDAMRDLAKGIKLEDGMVKAKIYHAEGRNLGASKGTSYHITVFEGRNRLVRRIFEHFDLKVLRLVRYGFGDLRLDDNLAPGDYRQLKSDEIKYLKDTCDL